MPPAKLDAAKLLSRGYFPRELPPPFTTKSFQKWAKANAPVSTGPALAVTHNFARAGGLRRRLSIPNPLCHAVVCAMLQKHWSLLAKLIYPGRLAASRPRVSRVLERAVVPRYVQRELPKLRALKRRGARYYLRTDISQFYHSIYTHSLPWALHTKKVAKAQKGKTAGDEIDKALRNQQSGQTVGIPIGPDASLLVAEVVLAAVDAELTIRHKELSGFRYVDDYEFYFDSLQQAEDVLQDIESTLAEYELLLNPRKTSIQSLPTSLDEGWHVELSHFPVRDAGKGLQFVNDLVALFSRAFEISSAQPEASVMKYLLLRVGAFDLNIDHWRTVEGLLCAAIAAEPSAIPACLSILVRAKAAGKSVSPEILGATLDSIIRRAARVGHAGECAWALWCATAVGISLGAEAGAALSQMEDDIVALLSLHALKRKLLPKSVDVSKWQSLVDVAGVSSSDHWLLAYESAAKRWLAPSKYLSKEFQNMQKAGVIFFNDRVSGKAIPSAAKALPGGTLTLGYF